MRRPVQQPKQPAAKPYSWPAPRDGWIANLNLAQPGAKRADGQPLAGAKVLDNWFPTATGIQLTRGSQVYATLGEGTETVTALFSYVAGSTEKMFGATESTIYDITTILQNKNQVLGTEDDDFIVTDDDDFIGWGSTIGLEVYEGLTGGKWITAQMATAGGIFLIGVNGEDDPFIYDGTTFYPMVAGGISTLAFDGGTVEFTVGETLTGGTSGATATIVKIIPTDPDNPEVAGTLWLRDVASGPFQNDEVITDGDGGAAVADGADASVAITDLTFAGPPVPPLTGKNLSYVWAYKQRLYFIEKDSLNVWYLDADTVSGELKILPLGGVFERGGLLVFGATWSNDSGNQGGLSEQIIFVTNQGEVAVYQGLSPEDTQTWQKVGVYQIGIPRGPKAWVRDGGDLIIATSIGFVRMTEAIKREAAALGPYAVSYPIEVAWNTAVELRPDPWETVIWAAKQMAVVALPTQNSEPEAMFLANVRTGAWCRRLGWDGTCLLVFKERLFFGSEMGLVYEANVTGADDGAPYTGVCVPLFDNLTAPASLKITEMVMAMGLSPIEVNVQTTILVDFADNLPAPPPAVIVPVGSEWGSAIWGAFTWGQARQRLPRRRWEAAAGHGYYLSAACQLTSGDVIPLDYELVSTEITYRVARPVS